MKRNHAGRKLASNFETCGEPILPSNLNEEIKNETDMDTIRKSDVVCMCIKEHFEYGQI